VTVFAFLRRRVEAFGEDAIAKLLDPEAEEARRLYADGFIKHIYSRQDVPGAVMQLEVASVDEAKRVLQRLPMVASEMMETTYVPVGPYRGFLPRG
jgi:muconolactone delta-isomerase